MALLDALKDIVKHTHSLGFIEMVKVVGSTTDLKIETMDADKSVIIYGSMYQPEAGIESTIGLSRLAILKGYIGLHEGSTVSIVADTRNGLAVPTEILFDDGAGSVANYRFVSETMINEQIKVPTFKGASWDVVFAPSKVAITKLNENFGILGGFEKRFVVAVDAKGTVKFNIGSGPTDRVTVPFATGVTGALKHQWTYPLSQVLSILKLSDTASAATMHFSDSGALKIEIDSGIGKYTYILPAGKV
jgi:hypothetical protein